VLAADQVAVLGEGDPPRWRQLHKPGTHAAAVAQLLQLSGREHRLITAVVLRHAGTGVEHEAVDEVVLHMRAFDRAEAQAYVDAFAPLDCAGSYRIEDRGITLMRAIEARGPCGADPTSIEGLPLLLTAQLLRRAGVLGPREPRSDPAP
jgi:septum formation protein